MFVPPEHLLPSVLLDELGRLIAAVYGDLEAQLVARARAILTEGLATPDDSTARMRAVQQLEAEARRMVAGMSPHLAADMIEIAAERGIQAAIAGLGLVPDLDRASLMRPADARAITALTAGLQDGLREVSRRILRYPQDVYQRITAWSAPGVLAGQDTLLAAQRRAVQRFLSEGVTGFVDVADRQWRIGTYAEMATRTAVARAWTDSGISTMHDAGITLVSIVVGNSACKRCAHWATRILSTDGTPAGVYEMPHATQDHMVRVRVDGTLDDARAAGLMHPNCGCAAVAYLPGLTVAEDATTYSPEAERERTTQRELEREARHAKRRIAAGEDPKRATADLKEAQAALRAHTAKTGQHRRSYREQLWFTNGPPGPVRRGQIVEGKPYPVTLHGTYTRLAAAGFDINPLPGAGGREARISGARWVTHGMLGDGRTLTADLKLAGSLANRAVIDLTGSSLPAGQALERISIYAGRSHLSEVLLITPDRVLRFNRLRGWSPVS